MRLTKKDKEQLLLTVLMDQYGERLQKSFDILKQALVQKVLSHEQTRSAIETYKTLPQSFKPYVHQTCAVRRIVVDDTKDAVEVNFYLHKSVCRYELETLLAHMGIKTRISLQDPIPQQVCATTLPVSSLPTKEFEATQKIAKEAVELNKTISSVLDSINTVKQLLKVMPAMKKYVNEDNPTSTSLISKDLIDKANKMLRAE